MTLRKNLLLIALAFITGTNLLIAQTKQIDDAKWVEDFDFVVDSIRTNHPNPYFRISQKDFADFVDKQRGIVQNSDSPEECLTAIMKVVAKLRDGHTQIHPKKGLETNNWLPLRTYLFEDGTYIISITEEHQSLIRAKLIEINGVPIGEVEDRLNSIIPSDNDFGRRNFLPMYLSNAGYLKGLGIVKSTDFVKLKLETKDGTVKDVELNTISYPYSQTWFKRSFSGPGDLNYVTPFCQQIPEYLKPFYADYVNFRYKHYKDKQTLYLQINQLVDAPDLSFQDFQNSFWDYFDANAGSIESLILDLRFNTGGNGPLLIKFMKELVKREDILKTKEFSVMIGRQTFSAAIMLVSQLKTYTDAIFIGEPMGGPLHLWSTALQLGTVPSKNFEFHVSSIEFHLDLPTNKSYMFPPQIPVVVNSEDFFSGDDKMLEYIFNNDLNSQKFILKEEIYVDSTNEFMLPMQAYSEGLINKDNLAAVKDKARKLNYNWGFHSDECGFYPYGSQIKEPYLKYELLYVARSYAADNNPEYAEVFFELLTILLPDYPNGWLYYAEFLNKNGEKEKATGYYKKTLELNPDSVTAKKRLEELNRDGR